jgi:hypothetical protein
VSERVTLGCITCGVDICLPATRHAWLVDHPGEQFYCPNGHAQSFAGEKRSKRELADRVKQLERRTEMQDLHLSNLLEQRLAVEEELRTCPICGERVPWAVVSLRRTGRMAQHLVDAHGARDHAQRLLPAATGGPHGGRRSGEDQPRSIRAE